MSVGNGPCMVKPIVIALNPVELNNYPLLIILDKCNVSCNAVDDLFTKIYVISKAKDVNVKVFNIMKKRNEEKTLIKHISLTVNVNSVFQRVIQIKME